MVREDIGLRFMQKILLLLKVIMSTMKIKQ